MAERENEFEDTPTGWATRWTTEFSAAKKFVKPWHKQADTAFRRYLDDRKEEKGDVGDFTQRLNLFNSNITTLQSMLYGRIPKVDVDRRYADQDDDVARVAGEILQRILNTDIEDAGEDYSYVLRSALGDRLVGGLGTARVKYDFNSKKSEVPEQTHPETGEVIAEAYTDESIEDEWVDVNYTHWRDLLWSPCRTYAELRWRAYRVYMTRDELIARFKDMGKSIPLNSKGPDFDPKDGKKKDEVWNQAEVWEIWDKQNKQVFWFVEGYDKVLDRKPDFLKLEGFFPEPPPLMSNLTTNKYLPKPDYTIAQDLYNDIDVLETRIALLTEACKAVGVYEKGNDGIQRVLMEGVENQLIPVDNWAAFSEKGGLEGGISWLPIEQVAKTIEILSAKQGEKINQLYQVTGMADILRGASTMAASATEQAIKAKFASIRVQALQDEFARFASDLMRLKAEIISKHYQPYCILKQSNIQMTPDAQLAQQAVQLIKDPAAARWKIVVKPESLAMVDYAQLKQDRTEYINALAVFLQSAAPILEMDQSATGTMLELLKWGLAGFKGSQEIEGVLDRAISDFKKQQQAQGGQKKPSPEEVKAQAEIKKTEMELQKVQMQAQGDMAENQQKQQLAQQEFGMKQQQMQLEMQAGREEHAQEMEIQKQKFQLELAKIRMQMIATFQAEKQQAESKMTQDVVSSAAQVQVESAKQKNGRDNGSNSK